mgnify:FL=1
MNALGEGGKLESRSEHGVVCCAHCGEPVPTSMANAEPLVFCCDGCRAVYGILQENGLCSYYDVSTERPIAPPPIGSFDYSAFDDPTARSLVVESEVGDHAQLVFTVPNIHCASCVWLLERLERLDNGILKSRVDLLRKTVRIDANLSRTTVPAVASLLASLGYPPVVTAERGSTQSAAQTRAIYLRLGVAGFAMANVMIFSIARYLAGDAALPNGLDLVFAVASVLLSLPVLLYSATPWFSGAWAALKHRALTLDVPVALGIAILFVRSIADVATGTTEGYLDSFNGLVFFLLVGRLFQQKAFDAVSFDRTWRSFFPLTVRRIDQGASTNVPIDAVRIGDVLSLRPGEVVPCDATLDSPVAYVDYAFVTGESTPVECVAGDTVHAGGRVLGRAIVCTVAREAHRGYLTSLWERQTTSKQRSTLLDVSTRFGKVFVVSAVAIAVGGALWWLPDLSMSLQVLTAVLIIACPCALTLAAPVTLGTAMGRLARHGVFLKNIGALIELSNVNTVVFDKTGTLTQSTAIAEGLEGLDAAERLLVAAVASQSTHPVSRALYEALPHNAVPLPASVREVPGCGVYAVVDGRDVVIGNAAWVDQACGGRIESESSSETSGATHIAIDGELRARVYLRSAIRKGVSALVETLRNGNDVRLVSGDSERDRSLFTGVFHNDEMTFNAMPDDKVRAINGHQVGGRRTVMIGDGLNDGPALGAADVAIAVTDDTATIVPACDVIMRANAVTALPALLAVAKATRRTVWVNFIVSMVYNAVGLTLAVMGLLSPLVVAILMPVSSLTVIAISVVGARRSVGRYQWA